MLQGNLPAQRKTSAELRDMLCAEKSAAREKLSLLFDAGTFAELGSFVKRTPTELDSALGAKSDSSEFESVICGWGAVNGALTFAFAQDFSKMKGALSASHAKKIISLIDAAIKNGAPLVCIFDSAGALIADGVGALAGFAGILKKLSEAKGSIPTIAVCDGICAGSAAAAAALCDVVCASKTAQIYVNPPFITKKQLGVSDAGTAAHGAQCGLVDIIAEDSDSLIKDVKNILGYLPANSGEGTVRDVTNDDLNRLTPEIETLAASNCDVRDIITVIADEGKFTELGQSGDRSMVCGFMLLGGTVVGALANNSAVNAGRISAHGASKAADFIDLCDSFSIPLISLVNTEGYAVTPETENADFASSLASLAEAYALSDCVRITLILGAAYGGAYVVMGSKELGADVVFALDSAKIGALSADAAQAFLDGGKKETAQLWETELSSPLAAARDGQIDDIIACEETRQRLISAINMLTFSL
ncbi:MAG: carboxyl transferase domain-containing protein [Eubacteriales bacterium]